MLKASTMYAMAVVLVAAAAVVEVRVSGPLFFRHGPFISSLRATN